MNKTSVLRAIKAGKLSGTKDEHGQWFVEPAELHRVYPPVADATPDVELRIALAAAERELAALKEMATELRAQRDDLRMQRDDMRAQREDMQAQRDVWQAEAQRLALPEPRSSVAGAAPPLENPPVTKPVGARLRDFLFESDPIWRWPRRRRAG
jgi:hypothetical protein